MPKGKQKIVSADLSQSMGLFEWFEKFKKDAGLKDSAIIRKALNYYRASTGPDVVLLQKRLSTFESAIGGPKYGWRGEVDRRLDTLESRSQ